MHAQAALDHWLRLLWARPLPTRLDVPAGEAPFIADGTLHLSSRPHWFEARAAAAHAAAHRVYSPGPQDGAGLAPLARALFGLLEDARVETLAARELPGLARLWRPLHTAGPQDGDGLEALMARLAHALADPSYIDGHPWVKKGRQLVFADTEASVLRLHDAADVRVAATRLGHDIGQMRRAFDARRYRPLPAYRDDHRWLWQPDRPPEAARAPPDVRPAGGAAEAPEDPEPAAVVSRLPEWDRRIGRLRPDWVTVVEREPPPRTTAPGMASASGKSFARAVSVTEVVVDPRLLASALRSLVQARPHRRPAAEGDEFDLDALVDARVAMRRGQSPDARVFRERVVCRSPGHVWLLLDRSASSAERRCDGRTVLEAACRVAVEVASVLRRGGVACTLAAFDSNGRHALRITRLPEPVPEGTDGPGALAATATQLATALAAAGPAGSSRLGAAIRHATVALAPARVRGATRRWVLLLSDGEAHDIDMHDPADLVADARHAVRSARASGVRVACLAPTDRLHPSAPRIFGQRATQPLATLRALPAALRRLVSASA